MFFKVKTGDGSLSCLLPHKISNLLHPPALVNRKRTSAIAMAAGNTVGGMLFESEVVLLRHIISCLCKIIEFIYSADIQTGRTWCTVIAIDTFPMSFRRSKAAYNAVIERLLRLIIVFQQKIDLFHTLCPRKNREDSRLI